MRAAGSDYALVHVVAQEADKDLIGPQVLDNAAAQLAPGAQAPAVVAAAFFEPLRHAFGARVRRRMRAHARRRPGVRVVLMPYVSRLGRRRNARVLAARLRAVTGRRPVVLHCRGESAVEWAQAIAEHLESSVIVADIRGAWPEELLFARGFDGRERADAAGRAAYDAAVGAVREVAQSASAVISVSGGMIGWLRDLGVPGEKLSYIPCCVAGLTFDANARLQMRRRWGIEERLVFCYLGTITRYQHVEDGVLPFFRLAVEEAPDAHLLCITPEVLRMKALIAAAGIPAGRTTVVSARQVEVSAYLSAADAGFLLRAPSRLNRLSQPTKLGEYLAAGVPVIVSRGTGQVDEMIEREQAGAAVTVFGLTEAELRREVREVCTRLRTCGDAWRANALALCKREFEWGSYTSAIRGVYVDALTQRMGRSPNGAIGK